jgi:plastocyanin
VSRVSAAAGSGWLSGRRPQRQASKVNKSSTARLSTVTILHLNMLPSKTNRGVLMPPFKDLIIVSAAVAVGFAATSAAASATRTFTLAAIEPKGGVTVDTEPFPSVALPEGGGYVLKQPNAEGRWEIAAYLWSAQQIIVNEGDDVTLQFVGINGASHPTTIEGYDQAFTLKRGEVRNVSFKADKAGVFKIICAKHGPTMVSELVVTPKS